MSQPASSSHSANQGDSGTRYIADRIHDIGVSGIRKIFDLASRMKDPFDFSMGQPDFDVPVEIQRAAVHAIEHGGNGYTVTHGLPALREAVTAKLKRDHDWEPSVVVTSGLSGGLCLAMMSCLNPGDEVMFADPYFVSYNHLVNLFGGKPVPVDTYPDFQLDADRLEAAVTPKSRMILLNSPGNPTGVVYSPETIKAVCELAEKHDLLIVSDEIYIDLSYDGHCETPVSFAPHRTLLLRGFGKSYAVTGWRLGYAAGPADVIAAMARLQQYTFVCAPHPLQRGAIAALETDISPQVTNYRAKRDLVVDLLKGTFDFTMPAGGFYIFPKAPKKFNNASAFVEAGIAKNVLTIPGSAFSQRDTHFRISYAVDNKKLEAGCRILCNLAG
jgi:aspartate aminotransferase/aminotransferase